MTFRILSCDGGGIRGLLTALLIQDLDTQCGLLAKVDGFAGTSTGGLLALALAAELPIESIIGMYEKDGQEIFTPNDWFLDQHMVEGEARIEELLGAGPGLLRCQYKSTGLQQVVSGLLGTALLSQAKRFVVINSARLWGSQNGVSSWLPATFSNASTNPYSTISMVDAALATSAAPTYFPPHEIAGLGYFADGGVFANNPAMTAVAEALACGMVDDIRDLQVLSLGTGSSPQGIPPAAIPNPLAWGASRWFYPAANGQVPGMPLLTLTMDTTAELASVQAGQILGSAFQRANIALSKPYALDDWRKVGDLERETAAYIANNPDWQETREWVSAHWA